MFDSSTRLKSLSRGHCLARATCALIAHWSHEVNAVHIGPVKFRRELFFLDVLGIDLGPFRGYLVSLLELLLIVESLSLFFNETELRLFLLTERFVRYLLFTEPVVSLASALRLLVYFFYKRAVSERHFFVISILLNCVKTSDFV